jgi:hypothetical protein
LGALPFLAALGGGCAVEETKSTTRTKTSSQAIVKGTASAHDEVVYLAMYSGDTFMGSCSGTVVAPNLVLTARHCVSQTDEAGDCRVDGSAVTGARMDEELTAVGWGLTQSGAAPQLLQERSFVKVLDVGPSIENDLTQSGLGPSEFRLTESGCFGDSGGPAFASTGALVGVLSRVGGGKTDPENQAAQCVGADATNIRTHLADKRDLVARAFAAAGFTPIDEGAPPGAATGSKCILDVDCASNVCNARVCASRCDLGAACAADEACTKKGAVSICVPKPKPAPAEEPPAAEEESAAPLPTPAVTTSGGCVASPKATYPGGASALAVVALVAALRHRRGRRST